MSRFRNAWRVLTGAVALDQLDSGIRHLRTQIDLGDETIARQRRTISRNAKEILKLRAQLRKALPLIPKKRAVLKKKAVRKKRKR